MDYERKRGVNTPTAIKYKSNITGRSGYIVDLHLDNKTLDLLCKYITTDSRYIKRGSLMNLQKFLSGVDPKEYINDPNKSKMVSFINKGLEARLAYNINDPELVIRHINGGLLDDGVVNVNEFIGLDKDKINWLNDMISKVLKYDYVYENVDEIMDICTRFKSGDFNSKQTIINEFEKAVDKAKMHFRKATIEADEEEMFTLEDGGFEDSVIDTYNKLTKPGRKLITGMQGMNLLLGGGFEEGRVYMFFGLQGEGKSTMLLNLLFQLKKYNSNYKCKDPTKIPTVVLLTMENRVTESIQRLFGLSCLGVGKITEHNVQDVLRLMRIQEELSLNDGSPINMVIKFKATNSVDTSYLYDFCDELEDRGLEVIAFLHDYVGRIRSTEYFPDMRLELGAVTDEFKVFAANKEIPLITASQLNREASRHVDDARKNNKNDLVRLIGRANIAESTLMLNNIDGAYIITPEYTQDGERFLGVQLAKKRYETDSNIEFIYLPFFQNSLRLVEDLGVEAIYRTTLKTDFDMFGNPVDQQNGPRNFTKSPMHTNDIFDMDASTRMKEQTTIRGSFIRDTIIQDINDDEDDEETGTPVAAISMYPINPIIFNSNSIY